MRNIIVIIATFTALTLRANDEFSKFQSEKQKKLDVLSNQYADEVKKAQQIYEKALLDADKKYSNEVNKLDSLHVKLLEKMKVDADTLQRLNGTQEVNKPYADILYMYKQGKSYTEIAAAYTSAQLDAIISAMGLAKNTSSKDKKVEYIIENI